MTSRKVQREQSDQDETRPCGSDVLRLAGGRRRSGSHIGAGLERAVTLAPLLLPEQPPAVGADRRHPVPIGSGIIVHADRKDDDAPALRAEKTGIGSPGPHDTLASTQDVRTNVLILGAAREDVQSCWHGRETPRAIATPMGYAERRRVVWWSLTLMRASRCLVRNPCSRAGRGQRASFAIHRSCRCAGNRCRSPPPSTSPLDARPGQPESGRSVVRSQDTGNAGHLATMSSHAPASIDIIGSRSAHCASAPIGLSIGWNVVT